MARHQRIAAARHQTPGGIVKYQRRKRRARKQCSMAYQTRKNAAASRVIVRASTR